MTAEWMRYKDVLVGDIGIVQPRSKADADTPIPPAGWTIDRVGPHPEGGTVAVMFSVVTDSMPAPPTVHVIWQSDGRPVEVPVTYLRLPVEDRLWSTEPSSPR